MSFLSSSDLSSSAFISFIFVLRALFCITRITTVRRLCCLRRLYLRSFRLGHRLFRLGLKRRSLRLFSRSFRRRVLRRFRIRMYLRVSLLIRFALRIRFRCQSLLCHTLRRLFRLIRCRLVCTFRLRNQLRQRVLRDACHILTVFHHTEQVLNCQHRELIIGNVFDVACRSILVYDQLVLK